MAVIFGFAIFALVLVVLLMVMAAALVGLLLLPLLVGGLAALVAVATGTADPVPVALVAALVTLLVTRKRRGNRRVRAKRERPAQVIVENRPTAPPSPLAPTWRRARQLAPRHARRLEAAELAGAALLRDAEAQPLDLDLHEAAMLLTRHAPDLVASAESLCAADPAARERCTEEMVAGLEELAGVTGEYATRRRSRLHDSFATIRRHIADRTGSATR
ncbi:hypothetical protein [Sphingomonas aracearum]|uniref:Uncharacterized protein n=1 Tax=Sphingomonas aracearum TaxID=2283317 RepID=A0A369VS66_9SPHN|nr:hypothetical protein [Sphingomonas aracearum]RDE04515.1 hypothetical protein DVW87_12965 [Sphingomonas aracearum]